MLCKYCYFSLLILKAKTAEQKRAEDEQHWARWLNSYMERLAREADGVDDLVKANAHRQQVMNGTNPR